MVTEEVLVENWSNFVEGYVTGITVTNPFLGITFFLLGRDHKSYILKAEGVDRFIANEMREQNIIDRINLWDKNSDERYFRESLVGLVTGKTESEEFDEAFLSLIAQEISAIHAGKKLLLEIEPIYGVYAIVLARNVTLMLADHNS